jgi:hypothetical protein
MTFPESFGFFFIQPGLDVDVFAPNHVLIGWIFAPPVAVGININHGNSSISNWRIWNWKILD